MSLRQRLMAGVATVVMGIVAGAAMAGQWQWCDKQGLAGFTCNTVSCYTGDCMPGVLCEPNLAPVPSRLGTCTPLGFQYCNANYWCLNKCADDGDWCWCQTSGCSS